MTSNILNRAQQDKSSELSLNANDLFSKLIQASQYVGEVFSISYETGLVLIHDHYRKRVGGIPSLAFLIATRINLDSEINYKEEDASAILLRVMDSANLPNASEAERIRVETAQRVSGQADTHWDEAGSMDAATHNLLSFAGIKCRIIGTFFLQPRDLENPQSSELILRFGDDISNYYPNRGLKVYKPNASALAAIVNYRDYSRIDDHSQTFVIGDVRYASTNRAFQGVSNVEVEVIPEDLLGQKTAVFGMTRTGKSNTTKIILQSVFNLRFGEKSQRIGQIVFDPNGEYANENVQDDNSAIKNVWRSFEGGTQDDVITYGLLSHPNDPDRRLMLLNFYTDENLQIGKGIINASLAGDGSKYIQNFLQVFFEPPDASDRSASTRYRRKVLAYRALLKKAGFEVKNSLRPNTQGLFNQNLLDAMRNISDDNLEQASYISAANTFSAANPTLDQLSSAFEILQKFMSEKAYLEFDRNYVNRPNSSGDPWADDDFKKILTMFAYPNGSRQIGKVRNQHTPDTNTDYAQDIYNDLCGGKLIIIDQASGDPEINRSSASRIMWYIFQGNQSVFREGGIPPQMLIYVEEAHTLLPPGSDMDLNDVWVRTAKEGAKYNIGLVYATQEVSSIQKNILKNTANWFIGHLNNTDETRELCKYYDFVDFEPSIRRAQDRGFLRIKTLSNRFVIPVQIKRFEIEEINRGM
jgi:hypothetical protein